MKDIIVLVAWTISGMIFGFIAGWIVCSYRQIKMENKNEQMYNLNLTKVNSDGHYKLPERELTEEEMELFYNEGKGLDYTKKQK